MARNRNASGSPLFILAGNASCANRGSEAIVRSTIAILEREFSGCRFISSAEMADAARDPGVIRHPRVTHVTWPQGRRWFSAGFYRRQYLKLRGWGDFPFAPYLAQAHAFVGRAGDNLTLDYGEELPVRQLAAAERALGAGVPTILYGATIGPFDANPALEKHVMERLKRVDRICVRDPLTLEYLQAKGVRENICDVPDPAFVLRPEQPALNDEVLGFLRQGCLGLNLSPLLGRYRSDGAAWPEVALECLRAIDRRVNLPILLIPHVTIASSNDHLFMQELLRRLPHRRNPIVLVGPEPDACGMKWIISKVRFFIGARTHATIAALSSCVPTVTIGYSRKATGINRSIFGHEQWVMPLDQLSPENLASLGARLEQSAQPVRQHLESVMPAYVERAWSGGRKIREAIEMAQARRAP